MCDLLKAAETVVDEYKGVPSPHFHSLLVKLEEAIAATKARSEWVPVAERLPVVPEGQRDVCIWVYGGQFKSPSWVYWHLGVSEQLTRHFTHWMYRQDDTPAPPRSES